MAQLHVVDSTHDFYIPIQSTELSPINNLKVGDSKYIPLCDKIGGGNK